jgi:hypothetical protein
MPVILATHEAKIGRIKPDITIIPRQIVPKFLSLKNPSPKEGLAEWFKW